MGASTKSAPANVGDISNIKPKSYMISGIPEPLPEKTTLSDIIKTIPKEAFQKNMMKAWFSVLVTVVSVSLSTAVLHYLPWYLLPLGWFVAGTAWTGLFVIGHDCGHLSFARSHFMNDLVGTIAFLPLMYPFEPWRIQHNFHHNNTNKLHVDNAWQPFQTEYYESTNGVERFIMRTIKGPLWFMASIGHQIKKHFFMDEFNEEQRPKAKFSVNVVLIAAAIFFPAMYFKFGIWAIIKFWMMPWVGYHFWMSTFTMVHHTMPHLPFLPQEQWSDAQARLAHTAHCEYPAWIEYLCHHINVHVPHHVSTGIPSYNLRFAHNALKAHWGKYMTETVFGWDLIKDIISNCHLYDEQVNYVPFSASDNKKKQ